MGRTQREKRAFLFVEKSRKVHGERYSYCLNSYTRANELCSVICHKHGVFQIYPSNHLKGQGCGKCSGKLKMETQDFLIKARSIHGNKFDYSATVYRGALSKITFTCKTHNKVITQGASKHLESKGYPCEDCRKKASLGKWDTEKFIEEAKKVHGNKYGYDRAYYNSTYEKVEIFCKACQKSYFQTACQHVRGSGCHSCGVLAAKGSSREFYKSENLAYLYILKMQRGDKIFLKVGVARDVNNRSKKFRCSGNVLLGYVNVYQGKAKDIFKTETLLHREFTSHKLRFSDDTDWKSWAGYTECYPVDIADKVMDYIETFNDKIKLIGD